MSLRFNDLSSQESSPLHDKNAQLIKEDTSKDHSPAVSFYKKFHSLAKSLFSNPQQRRSFQVFALPLLLCLQACSIMHRPSFDEENGFRPNLEEVDDQESEQRRNDFLSILHFQYDHVNLALLSGIQDEQQDRIMRHFEELFEKVHRDDFIEYVRVCVQAKELLGITSFDRINPRVLREVVKNRLDPEYNKNKPAVVIVIARPDSATIGGVFPLNVETYQIEELIDYYKVFLVECDLATEVYQQVNYLIDHHLIRRDGLRGFVIGSHGYSTMTSTGIDGDNLQTLFRLTEVADPAEFRIVFAHCYSGKDTSEGDNLVNRATLFFREKYSGVLKVTGCNGLLMGVYLKVGPIGGMEDLKLQSPANILTFNLWDDTYTADPDTVYEDQYPLLRNQCKSEISDEWVEKAVRLGLCNPELLDSLWENKILPENFVTYIQELSLLNVSLPWRTTINCIKNATAPAAVESFARSKNFKGLEGYVPFESIRFHQLGITQVLVSQYRAQIAALSDSDIISLHQRKITPDKLLEIKNTGLELTSYALVDTVSGDYLCSADQLIYFGKLGIRDIYEIRLLLDSGVHESLYEEYQLAGVQTYYPAIEYAKKNIPPQTINRLREAGFDVAVTYSIIRMLELISVDECEAFGRAGIRDYLSVQDFLNYNIPPSSLTRLRAEGLTHDNIFAILQLLRRVPESVCIEYLRAGLSDPFFIRSYYDQSIPPEYVKAELEKAQDLNQIAAQFRRRNR